MTDHKPGTVATITVDGDVHRALFDGRYWRFVGGGAAWGSAVTDVRPLVVLDPEEGVVKDLRSAAYCAKNHGRMGRLMRLADQIEAQIKPKTPEPKGLGAVVGGREGNRWVRTNESVEFPWRKIGPVDRVSKWDAITSSYEPVSVLSLGVRKPRIPEPGLWGVVRASGCGLTECEWVNEGTFWTSLGGDPRPHTTVWANLKDPVLVREGIDS